MIVVSHPHTIESSHPSHATAPIKWCGKLFLTMASDSSTLLVCGTVVVTTEWWWDREATLCWWS